MCDDQCEQMEKEMKKAEYEFLHQNLKSAWSKIVRTYNAAVNQDCHQDTLYGIANCVAVISAQLEYIETMSGIGQYNE